MAPWCLHSKPPWPPGLNPLRTSWTAPGQELQCRFFLANLTSVFLSDHAFPLNNSTQLPADIVVSPFQSLYFALALYLYPTLRSRAYAWIKGSQLGWEWNSTPRKLVVPWFLSAHAQRVPLRSRKLSLAKHHKSPHHQHYLGRRSTHSHWGSASALESSFHFSSP